MLRCIRGVICVGALLLCAGRTWADDAPPSYVKDVRPLLNKYCVDCHKTGMKKGGANLESYESIMKGGKNGAVVVILGKTPAKPGVHVHGHPQRHRGGANEQSTDCLAALRLSTRGC